MSGSDIFKEEYSKLNKAQKEAVDTIEGPVMVIAGPGTGKTQILALRIGNILKKGSTEADGVLCLTFTNSGVQAMKKRLHAYIGTDAGKVHVSTFHTFAMNIIEEYYSYLDFKTEPKIIEEIDMINLVDEIFHNHTWDHISTRGNVSQNFKDIKSLISVLKRERMSPNDFLVEIEREIDSLSENPENISSRGETKGQLKKEIQNKIESLSRTAEVVKFYELYEEKKFALGFVDYDDVLMYLVKLVEEHDDVRDSIREKYLYILVDEHQDSSGVQNEFLKKVWGDVEMPNVFVVGDDRQLIYGFGGASISYFESFTKYFKGTTLITLTDNYRSHQNILDVADLLLKSHLTKGKLISNTKGENTLELIECSYPRDEIVRAGLYFKEQIKNRVKPEECVLLLPKNAHVRNAISILRGMGLEVSSEQNVHLFDTPEALLFLRILRVIQNPHDTVSIGELLLDPISKIPPLVAHEFLFKNHPDKLSLQLLLGKNTEQGLFGNTDPVSSFGERIKVWMDYSKTNTVYGLIQKVGNELFVEEGTDHPRFIQRVEVVRSFIHLALSHSEKNKNTTLASFVSYIERLNSYETDIPLAIFGAQNGIKVATLHGSKGLEFKAVWIAHMTERGFMSSKKSNFALPESLKEKLDTKDELTKKRELYVAITRAKEFCVLSHAKYSYKGDDEELAHIIEPIRNMFTETTADETEKYILAQNPKLYIQEEPIDTSFGKKEIIELVSREYVHKKVSVTLLNTFFECPWKWYFKSFLQLPEPMSASLEFGSLVHSLIEQILKKEISSDPKTFTQSINQYVVNQYPRMSTFTPRMEADAVKVLTHFTDQMLPSVMKDFESEKKISYKDPQFPDLTITGAIDLVEYLNDKKHVRVTDYKTGGTKLKKDIDKVDDEHRPSSFLRQLAMYSYLINRSTKGDVHVDTSRLYFAEETDIQKSILEEQISNEEIDLLLRDIQDYDIFVKNGTWVERQCNFKPWGTGVTECPYCTRAKVYI